MITINDIKPYKYNVKDHPDTQLELITKVIKEIGWRVPVEVNQKGIIVAGHGRWIVWNENKNDPNFPPIWIIDDMGNTIHGKHDERPLTEDQERMWRIADNKITELATWNMSNFAFEMDKIEIEEFKAMTGFDTPDFDTVNDVEAEWEGMPEVNTTGDKIEHSYKSLIVHFESEEDLKDFGVKIGQKVKETTKYIWYPYKEKEDVKGQEFINEDYNE